jgi:hypothetical protein
LSATSPAFHEHHLAEVHAVCYTPAVRKASLTP